MEFSYNLQLSKNNTVDGFPVDPDICGIDTTGHIILSFILKCFWPSLDKLSSQYVVIDLFKFLTKQLLPLVQI